MKIRHVNRGKAVLARKQDKRPTEYPYDTIARELAMDEQPLHLSCPTMMPEEAPMIRNRTRNTRPSHIVNSPRRTKARWADRLTATPEEIARAEARVTIAPEPDALALDDALLLAMHEDDTDNGWLPTQTKARRLAPRGGNLSTEEMAEMLGFNNTAPEPPLADWEIALMEAGIRPLQDAE